MVKGYKAFNKDLTCRNFQYEIGKEYKLPDGKILEICESGFHFCKTIADCYKYYPTDGDTRICKIEALGHIVEDEDGIKFATDYIKIVKEITNLEMLLANVNKSNTGYCNSGDSNSGNFNSGNNNSGDYNSGDHNLGNFNSGYYNSGVSNSGGSNSGYRNSGEYNSGDYNTGDYNTGSHNSGYCNSGDRNSGSRNFGKYNSGNKNSGHWNTGNFNSGNYNSGDYNYGCHNSGCFCTEINPKIKMFDKESDWTYGDWLKSAAYTILSDLPYSEIKIISLGDMTDEEIKLHPEAKTTGCYLKKVEVFNEDRQKWWDSLSDEDKQEIFKLPNFDSKKFKLCTGIDTNKEA